MYWAPSSPKELHLRLVNGLEYLFKNKHKYRHLCLSLRFKQFIPKIHIPKRSSKRSLYPHEASKTWWSSFSGLLNPRWQEIYKGSTYLEKVSSILYSSGWTLLPSKTERHRFRGTFFILGSKVTVGLLGPLWQGVGHRTPWLHNTCSEDTPPPFQEIAARKDSLCCTGLGSPTHLPPFQLPPSDFAENTE